MSNNNASTKMDTKDTKDTKNANDTTTTTTQRKQSPLQVGIDCLRDPNILNECKQRISSLVDTVKSNNNAAFDLLYLDVPWKHVDIGYLQGLPLNDLVVKDALSGLLLWVDSSNLADAFNVINTWGFTFHSVLHIVYYDNKLATTQGGAQNNTTNTTTTTGNGSGTASEAGDETTTTATTETTKTTTKKVTPPHGWQTDGIVTSRSRQLIFAYREADTTGSSDANMETQDSAFTRIFKDFSFIRKRLGQISSFSYPETNGDGSTGVSTGLSSKKKNIENWIVYPNYDVYTPNHLKGVFETFIKPNTKVLSLFTNGLSKTWYSWGPNVPGYINGPLRPDSGFGLLCALQKYFSCMKTATVNKYLTLVNLYIIQLAKQEGIASLANGNEEEPCIGTLVLQRFNDFLVDLQRKAESAGGVKDGPLNNLTLVQLKDLPVSGELNAISKAQLLVEIAQVIKYTLRKISEAASHRKKIVKRKREDTGEEGENKTAKTTPARKYGIAAPVDISPELANFMNVPAGTPVARTAVVKFINKYIVDNGLQNPERKSEILVEKDPKLLVLLKPDPNFGTVTYFNLCKLLGPHFIRSNGNASNASNTNNPGNVNVQSVAVAVST